MPSLFPPWADTAFKVALAAVAVAIPGVFVIPIVYVRTPYNLDRRSPVDQPLQFDHRHHVQDDGIECLYCHSGAERTAVAGVPPTELCMGCHSQIWNTSPMLEPVRRSYFSGLPIAWSRVHLVPDFVFFNHAIHVGRARVACAECHGDVAAMALPHRERLFTMGWCLDCHTRRAASLPAEPALAARGPARKLPPDAPEQAHTLPGATRITTCTTCHR